METHLNEDGSEIPCKVPFSIVTPHHCKIEDADEEMKDSGDENDVSIPEEEVKLLKGHSKEVYVCAWNNKKDILASGSADTTARIWRVRSDPSKKGATPTTVLPHQNPATTDNEEVSVIRWDPTGNFLATGAVDGVARIWTAKGTLKHTLVQHKEPIFSLKWNKEGNFLLSGSADHTAIVWDVAAGEMKQQFAFHGAPTLDVDWKDNKTFATCSSDHSIHVGEIGTTQSIRRFDGHKNEVNTIKWCPAGRLLASCSDDCTAKLWSMDAKEALYDFKEHEKELYTIEWSPTGAGTANPNRDLMLASASFDSTVRLWNIEQGRCLHNLAKHTDPVYSISFSPDGQYLASGSFDHYVHIWSVSTGEVVKSYRGGGGIFEVCWNTKGDKIAACFDTNNIAVIDFRM
eukprot:CAMPEP_0206185292 /NCGR_PEP_ID=MMETSP0166-20121206/1717_1 /ASSEMBLY_ACC=CAM_ASM_000260 /TAXON_ID=95228 /ORGANISM="Vannella robusta, Strain DIVA3 518/3/11/1/6" /LENGTH=401 /DNA_ID=CAMNT_0053600451 /DNA_START=976 /DNA_END=2181 /DNA_ORIENTATION=-